MTKKEPLVVQSVLLSKENFTKTQAKRWIEKHNFKKTFYGKDVEVTENFYRFRQKAVRRFKDKSFRTKEISEGVKIVLGNLK